MRVLLAEDDARLAETMARGLRRHGMAVDVCVDGLTALQKARTVGYDVVVLDRDLPDLHGDMVCRRLLDERPDVRVLMVTAAGGPADVVHGLRLGADDYLTKPFDFDVLVARIQALARRRGESRPPVLRRGDVELDAAARSATRNGRALELSPKELGVLEVLLEADGAAVGLDELMERVWDEHTDPWSNTLRMTVMTLRRKLGDPAVVETVKGVGYRL